MWKYLNRQDHLRCIVILSDKEIDTAFFSLKTRKSPGLNEIIQDIVKQNFDSLLVPY